MPLPAEPDIDVEVHADAAVPTAATARAVGLVRRLAAASGRRVRYAAVTLGVNDQWPGRRSSQAEIVIDAGGIYVRGFAAGITFAEALDELERKLERRLGDARDRVRSRAGRRSAPVRPLRASRATTRPTARAPSLR